MKRRTFWNAGLAIIALTTVGAAAFAQGPPPGGGRGFGGPGGGGFGGPGGGGAQFLLMLPEVQKELKLDAAQVDLLQGLRQGGPGGPGGGRQAFEEFQKLSPEERQKRFTAMRQQEDKKVAEILDAKQLARLKQLQLQQRGVRALGQSDVADSLKLTPDQKQRVQTAMQGEQDGMRQMFQGFQPGAEPPSDEQRQQIMKKMQDLRTGTDSKLNAVLTESQKAQFKQMQGAPFTFPQQRFGGFGGPGGPGGQRPPRPGNN